MPRMIGNESYKPIVKVKKIINSTLSTVFDHDFGQYFICFITVSRLVPAFWSKKQSSNIIQFSIRSVASTNLSTVGLALPAEVAVPFGIGSKCHISFRPFPKFIELFTVIQLYTNHHAVRHPFGAHIVVASIQNKGCTIRDLVINRFFIIGFITVQIWRCKEMLPYLLEPFINLLLVLPQ